MHDGETDRAVRPSTKPSPDLEETDEVLADVLKSGKQRVVSYPPTGRSRYTASSQGLHPDGPFGSIALALHLQSLDKKEDQDLAAQRSPLLEYFECAICFESLVRDHIAEFDVCKHSYCRDCLRNHITSTLHDRRYPIFCPSCVAESADYISDVDDGMFESLGPTSSEVAIFQELQLASHSVSVHCPKCKETMLVDRGDFQANSDVIVCPLPRCNQKWCKNCQQPNEAQGPLHSCDGSSELDHLMKEKGWRHCPGCQTPIQKESGCNHMMCTSPGCNAHFCYRCGGMITQSVVPLEAQTAVSEHYQICQM